LPPIEGAVKST